jgi:hypothetical protein
MAAMSSARADVTVLTFPTNVNIPNNAPPTFMFSSVAAMNGLFGYTLSADWSSASAPPNDAFSNELRVAVTASGVASFPAIGPGGNGSSSPFVFPGSGFGRSAIVPVTTPVNTTTGDLTVTFSTTFSGSTAQLANASLTLYHNPTSYSATTVGGPSFIRPNEDGSASVTSVSYHVEIVRVSQTGRYLISSPANYDNMLFLYESAFDPLNPTASVIAANDAGILGFNSSELSATLTAGVDYYVVNTAFGIGTAGTFTTYMAGPGVVTVVPEPAGAAAVLIGIIAIRKARSRKSTGDIFQIV